MGGDTTFLAVLSKTGFSSNLNLKERNFGLDEDPGETEVQGCFGLTKVTPCVHRAGLPGII